MSAQNYSISAVALAGMLLSSGCGKGSDQHTDPPVEGDTGVSLPETATVPAGKFMLGSDYAKTVACTDGVPPKEGTPDEEHGDDYCKLVGPHVWFVDEQPIREVTIGSPLAFSNTEVTVGQFSAFVEDTGYVTTAEKEGKTLGFDGDASAVDTFVAVTGFDWRRPWPSTESIENFSDHPVVHVSFEDAQAYCDWLSKKTGSTWRLPSAEEWEYAALGEQTEYPASGTYSWGPNLPDEVPLANVSDVSFANQFSNWRYPILSSHNDSFALSSPAGSFEPNGYGLFDMTGNVWEWTTTTVDISGTDGSTVTYPVMKGGAFDFEMPFQRVQKNRNLSFVFSNEGVNTSISVGFRVVKEPE